MTPYYDEDGITIYHGDCREVLPSLSADVLITDPPYPNNAGWFSEHVDVARSVLCEWIGPALVFWSELERPPVPFPLVAIHIWHRANVNGRPYESIYHFAKGDKRRSEVWRYAVEFENATGAEYLGHPTQKPVSLMQRLLNKEPVGVVVDPFMGVASTLRAAKNLGRRAVGIEIEEKYCEIAVQRLAQGVLEFG